MRTNSRSRGRGLVLAVLTLVVSLPELARAQQTGLFPTGTDPPAAGSVRPGRPDLQSLQASILRLSSDVLADLPERLGMPKPRGTRPGKSFKEIPLPAGERARPSLDQPGTEEMTPPPGTTRPGMPALPGGGRSPFEDEPEQTGRHRPGNPRGGQNPRQLLRATRSSWTSPTRRRPRHQASRDRQAPGPQATDRNCPRPPRRRQRPRALERAGMNRPTRPVARDDDGPLLALPSVNLAPVDDPGVPFGTQPPPPAADDSFQCDRDNRRRPRRAAVS